MAIAEINIIPIGTKTPSLSQYIAKALEVLEEEKVKYELTSMGTIVEGDLDEILALAKKMHRAAFSEEVLRVVTTIKLDERRDKPLTTKGKIKAVEEKMDRKG